MSNNTPLYSIFCCRFGKENEFIMSSKKLTMKQAREIMDRTRYSFDGTKYGLDIIFSTQHIFEVYQFSRKEDAEQALAQAEQTGHIDFFRERFDEALEELLLNGHDA